MVKESKILINLDNLVVLIGKEPRKRYKDHVEKSGLKTKGGIGFYIWCARQDGKLPNEAKYLWTTELIVANLRKNGFDYLADRIEK